MPSHADRLLLLLLGVVVFSIPSPTSAIDIAAPANLCAQIGDLEVEHRSALKPAAAAAASAAAAAEEAPSHWTPPVLDANEGDGYRFEWRVAAALAETDGCHGASTLAAARNVTQLSAVLTLTPTVKNAVIDASSIPHKEAIKRENTQSAQSAPDPAIEVATIDGAAVRAIRDS